MGVLIERVVGKHRVLEEEGEGTSGALQAVQREFAATCYTRRRS